MKAQSIVERRNKIVELVNKYGLLRVSNAVEIFQVSDETIRKDIAYLDKQGILKKVHGGAVALKSDTIAPINIRQTENHHIKFAICQKALEYIPEDQCIIGLDMGSTLSLLSTLIKELDNKIIITNSFPALQELILSKNKVISTGGEYSPHDMYFRGEFAKNNLQHLAMDICFMGTSGVLNRDGICSTNFYDVDVKREFLKRSRKSIVLLDSSKFNKSSLVKVAEWDEIDLVITDSNIREEDEIKLSQKTQLEIVDVSCL